MKSAFISGVSGQDGAILSRQLIAQGYKVFGTFDYKTSNPWRLKKMNTFEKIVFIEEQNGELISKKKCIKEMNSNLSEIYLFSGYSSTKGSIENPKLAIEKIINRPLKFIYNFIENTPNAKIFVSGSSEIFQSTRELELLNEQSRVGPRSPYGFAHLAMRGICETLINQHSAKIFYGILFNHESAYRDEHFITRKLVIEFDNLLKSLDHPIKIGNFNSRRDFGTAYDFVRAMQLLLQTEKFGTYVFATGKTFKVSDLILEIAKQKNFSPIITKRSNHQVCIDLKTNKTLVEIDDELARSDEGNANAGDSTKLEAVINFSLRRDLSDFIRIIQSDS